MVEYEDMTEDERERFVYLLLSEQDLKAITLIMMKKYGQNVSTEQIMRFAFKVARNKMMPAHLKKKNKKK
ncbi:MAG: hypothetical protein A2086_09185 [Spirochaetes bacterium GWD1_27_9]|nr:MAG: hypothetical protein A2Z98_13000 [Spirochaetes bacterium GWB1_27_13]OHD20417.1 MAG: hypothetical protein A2Y34_10550 [Spirochaetes bacterium GWC1_27_15]OHD31985.1 MAG: hypothetical protein A2086_09185 [Spirochaetes bacterium GWD1_27_9]